MEVLLINVRTPSPLRIMRRRNAIPPLTLCYLAAPLLERGIRVRILDMAKEDIDRQGLLELLRQDPPKIVGITCVTESFSNCVRVSQLVKQNDPDTHVVVGGPHVTFTVEDTLSNPSIDYIVRGEGEITFAELADHLLYEKGRRPHETAGLAFRQNGSIQRTARRPFLRDLDQLPSPARHLLNLKDYTLPGIVFTGRGCIGKCVFCVERAMNGGHCRTRSLLSVFQEINGLVEEVGVNYLFFADETLTAFPDRTRTLCDKLLDQKWNITWGCESRVDLDSFHLLEKMAESGCVSIEFGGESGVDDILRSIRKGTTTRQIEAAAKAALHVGIIPSVPFIIGHPQDTRQTILQTIDFAVKLQRLGCEVSLSISVPYPGTMLFNRAKDFSIKILSQNWENFSFNNPVCNTMHLTADEIRELYFEANEALLFHAQ